MGIEASPESVRKKTTERIESIQKKRCNIEPIACDQKRIIFRAPPRYREGSERAFKPHDASIGPFHSPRRSRECNDSMQEVEDTKQQYYSEFLEGSKVSEDSLLRKLVDMEGDIRCWYGPYSKNIDAEFLDIILIDSCFLIQFFLKVHSRIECQGEALDLITDRTESDIFIDLLNTENQVPFRVIEELYNTAGLDQYKSLKELTFWYFKTKNPQGKDHMLEPHPVHFIDMYRNFMLPPSNFRCQHRKEELVSEVSSICRLRDAGVKFMASTSKCLLDVEFDKDRGVLFIPRVEIYKTTELYLRNLIAFEQHYYPKLPLIAEHVYFLSQLINTEDDVQTLVDEKIIANRMGENREVAKMFKSVSQGLMIQDMFSGYGDMRDNMNAYYDNSWHKHWADTKHRYFNTPWNAMSIICQFLITCLNSVEVGLEIFKKCRK